MATTGTPWYAACTTAQLSVHSLINHIYTTFLPREKVCPADKLHLQAATIVPFHGLARSKQDPINRGHGAQNLYRPPPAGARPNSNFKFKSRKPFSRNRENMALSLQMHGNLHIFLSPRFPSAECMAGSLTHKQAGKTNEHDLNFKFRTVLGSPHSCHWRRSVTGTPWYWRGPAHHSEAPSSAPAHHR